MEKLTGGLVKRFTTLLLLLLTPLSLTGGIIVTQPSSPTAVSGPAGGGTDEAIARWDGAGNLLQDSGVFIDNTGQMRSPLGTAAAPSFSFIGDLDTGIFSSGANDVTLSTGGMGRVQLTSSGHLQNTTSQRWTLRNTTPTSTTGNICPNSNDVNTCLGWDGADSLALIAGGVGGLSVVETGGNVHVGMGTTSPVTALHISRNDTAGADATAPFIFLENTNTAFSSFAQYKLTAGAMLGGLVASNNTISVLTGKVAGLSLYTNAQDPIIFAPFKAFSAIWLPTGEVGIGTKTPNSKLEVNGSFAVKRLALAVSGITVDEVIIGVTNTDAARTITIQTADITAGTRLFIIKDESGGAGTNNITVATQGSETIDGAATVVITANYGVARLYSNGTDLFTF